MTKTFGKMTDGQEVHICELKNNNGAVVEVLTLGAIFHSYRLKESFNVIRNQSQIDDYLVSKTYQGAIIGRYANRIKNSQVTIEGITYELDSNFRMTQHLHGGTLGLSQRVWTILSRKENEVSLQIDSKHLDQGYPGNLKITVTYTLNVDDSVSINYHASTDRKTVINLTNHAYFNLGQSDTISGHSFHINSRKYLDTDIHGFPLGTISSADDGCYDFINKKSVRIRHKCLNEKIINDDGYDVCYLAHQGQPLSATMECVDSNLKLLVSTSKPACQFYTANRVAMDNKRSIQPYFGFCIEPQHLPNAENIDEFVTPIYDEGSEYSFTDTYKLSLI